MDMQNVLLYYFYMFIYVDLNEVQVYIMIFINWLCVSYNAVVCVVLSDCLSPDQNRIWAYP